MDTIISFLLFLGQLWLGCALIFGAAFVIAYLACAWDDMLQKRWRKMAIKKAVDEYHDEHEDLRG